MKVLKSILIYVGIILAILFGLGIILFGIMYFFPSFRIFNVGLIHYNKDVMSETIDVDDYSGYDNIVINVNTKSLGVMVIPCEKYELTEDGEENTDVPLNEISCYLDLHIFGFASEITEYNVTTDVLKANGNKLNISYNVSEPKGWISTSGSEIVIEVPSDFNYTLNVTTESGDILLGNEDVRLNLKALAIDTSSGETTITNICDFEEDEIVLDYLNLKTDSSWIDLSMITNINVKTYTTIDSKSGGFTFENLFSSVVANGDNLTIKAKLISCDDGFSFVADKGTLEIEKLEGYNGCEVSVITEDCDINIGKLEGQSTFLTSSGKVIIGTIDDKCNIESDSANIEINNARELIHISTDSGDIVVKNYEKSADFVSHSGDINISNNSELQSDISTTVTATNGNIKVSNRINKLTLQTKGDAVVDITFKEIATISFEHKVVLNSGSSAVVYLPANNYNTPFMFIAKGNISGQISGVNSGLYVTSSDDPQYFPTSSDDVIEECKNNCSFIFNGTINFKGYSAN